MTEMIADGGNGVVQKADEEGHGGAVGLPNSGSLRALPKSRVMVIPTELAVAELSLDPMSTLIPKEP